MAQSPSKPRLRKPESRRKESPPSQRRSFSQASLAFKKTGPQGDLLAQALEVPAEGGYSLTHGFHPYPGRFHPHLTQTLLGGYGKKGDTVLDPFMGGGTTLIEAALAGRRAIGNDLNPVATLVAGERLRTRTAEEGRMVAGEAERIAGLVAALKKERNPPRVSLKRLDMLMPYYQRHLMAEMMQWIRLINALPSEETRTTLRAVFSAGAVKFSNQPSDSKGLKGEMAPPRYPKGAVSKFMVAKTGELMRAQSEWSRRLAAPPEITLLTEDARLLPSLGWGEADLVLTSPPYPGTYDYHQHHALRLYWLELAGAEMFFSEEMGATRDTDEQSWRAAMLDFFMTLARVVKPDGRALVVMGDWLEKKHPVDGGQALARIAKEKGWKLESSASVERKAHTEKKAYGRKGKWEHLLCFSREK